MKIRWIIGICLLGNLISTALADIQQEYKEVNQKFTYQGKPIHPGLVQQFMASIADSGQPTIIAVDVAADHGNQYYEGDVKIKDKNICTKSNSDGAYFCYTVLGKVAKDIQVLQVWNSTGGSGVFESLIFVRFQRGDEINFNGRKYKPLLMSIVGEYTLGDRDHRVIEVLPTKVIVGKDKPTVISF
jgi:hypothetical protein